MLFLLSEDTVRQRLRPRPHCAHSRRRLSEQQPQVKVVCEAVNIGGVPGVLLKHPDPPEGATHDEA